MKEISVTLGHGAARAGHLTCNEEIRSFRIRHAPQRKFFELRYYSGKSKGYFAGSIPVIPANKKHGDDAKWLASLLFLTIPITNFVVAITELLLWLKPPSFALRMFESYPPHEFINWGGGGEAKPSGQFTCLISTTIMQ